MNSCNDLTLRFFYEIRSHKSRRFQNWMEENFLLKILGTGHFFYGVKKMTSPNSADGMSSITYTLHPRDEESLSLFNSECLPIFSSYFHDEWVSLLRVNNLTQFSAEGWEREVLNTGLTKSHTG